MTYTEPNTLSQLPRKPHRHNGKIKLSPELIAALVELAAAEDIELGLLVTLLIRAGLDHHWRRSC
jgi:hypothetical protein